MYQQLPMIEVDISDLLLDLDNYRIPTHRDDEASALKFLFASEDVLGAARLILRDGYFDNEVPIVIVAESNAVKPRYVVLEGNRRVSALKTLNDPSLIPGHEKEMRQLLNRFAIEAQNLPMRIRVIVAPDRATAAPHVARLHTGVPKRRWSLDQQATYYYSLLDEQTTVEDVKAQYPDVAVVKFMKMAVMRRFLAAALFKDNSLRQFAASDDLKMSSFEYAYRNKFIAHAIGADFASDGSLIPSHLSPEQIAANLTHEELVALEYLLNEFRAQRLNTRSAAFKKATDENKTLIAKLTGVAASTTNSATALTPVPARQSNRSSGASPLSSHLTPTPGTSQSPTATVGTVGSRGPNHPDTKDTLDLSGLGYDSTTLNLKLRYFELRKISLQNFPTAAAVLLRTVLESTIKVHFESSATPVSGELSKVFPQVVNSYGSVKALKNTIGVIQSGTVQKHGSIQWFNLVTHSSDEVVSADDVRLAWKAVNPLLRHLLLPQALPVLSKF